MELFVTFLIGAVGSFISATAGAGVGLFTAYLLLVGVPAPTAIGTARLGGVGLNLSATWRFLRSGHIKWRLVGIFVFIHSIAALVGSFVLVSLSEDIVKMVIGLVLLLIAPLSLLKKAGLEKVVVTKARQVFGGLALFFTVAAQAAIGAGLGALTTLVYIYFFGFTALQASATRRLPSLIMTVISLAVFIYYGLVDYRHGSALLIGSLIGGYAGAHVAIKQGNKYVKIALAIVLVALGIRFIFGS